MIIDDDDGVDGDDWRRRRRHGMWKLMGKKRFTYNGESNVRGKNPQFGHEAC